MTPEVIHKNLVAGNAHCRSFTFHILPVRAITSDTVNLPPEQYAMILCSTHIERLKKAAQYAENCLIADFADLTDPPPVPIPFIPNTRRASNNSLHRCHRRSPIFSFAATTANRVLRQSWQHSYSQAEKATIGYGAIHTTTQTRSYSVNCALHTGCLCRNGK